MENPAPLHHIARDGQIIGAFRLDALAQQLKSGGVRKTDHYLIDGAQEWRPVAELTNKLELHEQERLERERAMADAARAEEERRKDEAALRRAREEREVRMAEAAKRRQEEEHRKATAWTCGNCSKSFAQPARTGDGQTDLRNSLISLAASIACGWFSWDYFKLYIRANPGDETRYLVAHYFFLGSAVLGLYAMARHLIIGGVAKGLDAYYGSKSSCPNCGSQSVAETKVS